MLHQYVVMELLVLLCLLYLKWTTASHSPGCILQHNKNNTNLRTEIIYLQLMFNTQVQTLIFGHFSGFFLEYILNSFIQIMQNHHPKYPYELRNTYVAYVRYK
jgi:hypothetical protein